MIEYKEKLGLYFLNRFLTCKKIDVFLVFLG